MTDTDFTKFMHAIYNARKRAKKNGMDCDLSSEVAEELWWRCGGKCEITGIPFDYSADGNAQKRAFIPSIDRKDNSKGYTASNVRVVCSAVNIAMNQWGEDVLYRIAAGLTNNKTKWKKNIAKNTGNLPRGVKVCHVTQNGPMYKGSKYINGIRKYTKAFCTPDEAIDALAKNDFQKSRDYKYVPNPAPVTPGGTP